MAYGSVREDTKAYIIKRATESGIDSDKLFEFDPDVGSMEDSGNDMPADLYEFSVIYCGALDESFYMRTGVYEVNIADWIAELLENESKADADPESTWLVLVSEYSFDLPGATRYRVASDGTD